MAYVGIDQSYTGFAVVVLNSTTLDHEANLGKFQPKYEHEVDRLLAVEDWIMTHALVGWDVDYICMEGYAAGAKFGREKAGELGYAVKRTLRARHAQQLVPTVVSPSGVKKFATGSGTAKKAEILLAVYKKWGAEFKDDNLADAYVLARIAHALGDPSVELTKYQQEVLDKLR